MAVVIIKNKVTKTDLVKASKDYGEYIKVVADIKNKIIAIGGKWHVDGERKLLDMGSEQKSLWGGGVDIKNKRIETIAIINLRSNQGNDSQEILDQEIRNTFLKIVKNKFNL